MKKILSLLLLAIMLLNFSTVSATEISTSGPVISEEPSDDFSKQISAVKDMAMSMPHNIKYDMGFVVGPLLPDGSASPASNGIATIPSTPLMYDYDIILRWNDVLYNYYFGVYNEDNSFNTYVLISGGSHTIQAGTKFCLLFQYKDMSVKIDSIYDDIFYSLNIVSRKDVVYRDTFFKEGIFTTEIPLDCLKEIYLEGAEDKEIVIGQIKKNSYANNLYWTTFYLAYRDAPTKWIARYLLQTKEQVKTFDKDVPIKLTEYNGSGVSGYAIVDYNQLEDGYFWQTKIPINMTKACHIALNPIIKTYLEDNGKESLETQIEDINKRISTITHELKYNMSFTIGGLDSSGNVTSWTNGIVTNTEKPLVYDFDIVVNYNPEISRFFYRTYKDDGTSTVFEDTTGCKRFDSGTKFRLLFRKQDQSAISSAEYDTIFNDIEITKDTADIISLNKDVEHLVMQASKSRSSKFGDTLVPLEFVHFTDIHSHKTEWKRIVEYIDKYEEYIDFAIHTGDYSGTAINQAIDLYSLAKPKNRIIYNAVGNHDTYSTYNNGKTTSATTEETYNAVFSDTENWDVVFGDEAYATYYYKDFYESGVRLIVLNDQQWSGNQGQWLSEVLADANQNGLAVITASHMSAGYMAIPVESSFTPIDNNYSFAYRGGKDIGPYIVEFKNNGGEHIAHLCGHNHFDDIGYTKDGILNIQLECASSTPGDRLESVRAKGTKNFDCFNVMAVDVNTKRIKIVRIGCNSNAALQGKTVLCYDYENKKVISNY